MRALETSASRNGALLVCMQHNTLKNVLGITYSGVPGRGCFFFEVSQKVWKKRPKIQQKIELKNGNFVLCLRTCRPGKKWVSGHRPEIGEKKAPEIGPEIGPVWKKGKKWGKIRNFWVLSYLFPIFSAGPISGPIPGAIFFIFRAGGPKPIFYQVGRFSILCCGLFRAKKRSEITRKVLGPCFAGPTKSRNTTAKLLTLNRKRKPRNFTVELL